MTNAGEHAEQVVTEERELQLTLSVRRKVPLVALPEMQGESLAALWRFMNGEEVPAVGPPFVRYHSFTEDEADVEVGIPISAPALGEGRIFSGELPGGPAITTWHLGSHTTLADAYARMQAELTAQIRKPRGAAWEVYTWIDPAVEPDPQSWPAPEEWRTQLVQPVA